MHKDIGDKDEIQDELHAAEREFIAVRDVAVSYMTPTLWEQSERILQRIRRLERVDSIGS